jgi:hypothetical protein
MSGYTDEAVKQQGVLVEDTAFIQKPFSMTDIAQNVREVIDPAI